MEESGLLSSLPLVCDCTPGGAAAPSAPRAPAQDHPALARKVLLQSAVRPAFPSLFYGRERAFEAGNILAVHGEKHKSLRAAWQPMFFSGRRGRQGLGIGPLPTLTLPYGEKHKSLRAAWQPMFFSGRRGPLQARACIGPMGLPSTQLPYDA